MNTTADYEQVDLRKVLAEIDKLRAEMLKMQTESKWHPVWVAAALLAAGAAFAKLFLA